MLNFEAFLNTIPFFIKGMAGVFLVTLLFILSIYILKRVFPKK